jgi:hypothetical protein
MSFALLTNFACMILCCAVMVQSMRLMRSLRAVKDGSLGEVVQSLDKATGLARAVLSDMKGTLSRDMSTNAQMLDDAKAIRDELNVMIGIGDAIAERIANAASAANGADRAEQAETPETAEAETAALVD